MTVFDPQPMADLHPLWESTRDDDSLENDRTLPRARPGLAGPSDPLEVLARELLLNIGEDPDREGLRDTPRRWARWWREFTEHDPGQVDTAFQQVQVDQMVAVTGVKVWSLCEHHLLPFSCTLTMAYLTEGRVLGLSKFARIANTHAHRLQLQERLVAGIAADLTEITGSSSVAVLGAGEHLCMTMRGVRTSAVMVSTSLRGAFMDNPAARQEFLGLAHAHTSL